MMLSDDSQSFPANPQTSSALQAGLLGLGLSLLTLAFAVSDRSLWIDEAFTARIAQTPNLSIWWDRLLGDLCSDLQMPFYSLWIWSCEKIVGSSELALRIVSGLWIIPATIVLSLATRTRPKLQISLLTVTSTSPFAWYYLNEARSYTLQLSCSMILFACATHWYLVLPRDSTPQFNYGRERPWVVTFCLALSLLCGSSLLAMILSVTPVVISIVALSRRHLNSLVRFHWPIFLTTTFILAFLATYYLWTLSIGARATDIATTNGKNVLFIAYELFGFAGLGPGRLSLRLHGLATMKPYYSLLAIMGLTTASLSVIAFQSIQRRLSLFQLTLILLSIVLPAGFILFTGWRLDFRVLGRHLAPLFSLAAFLMAIGIAQLRFNSVKALLAIVFFSLSVASCLSLRFQNRHFKDDYRAAAAIANKALRDGQCVWWNANREGAEYYGVSLSLEKSLESLNASGPDPRKAWLVRSPQVLGLALQQPQIVIVSRSDIFDAKGTLAHYLKTRDFQLTATLPGFAIWQLPNAAN